ncbi:hypothetical protein CDAR_114021 [Caerostris darwini]|uniref:Uncharacterized protein n=1 Tax=Caerostris darwini TaxID=1538125 RepID=A0AAV4RWS9_9ARAC|nr:hypothetical protein CDAR_114021 [Caerostris darwini]
MPFGRILNPKCTNFPIVLEPEKLQCSLIGWEVMNFRIIKSSFAALNLNQLLETQSYQSKSNGSTSQQMVLSSPLPSNLLPPSFVRANLLRNSADLENEGESSPSKIHLRTF